MSRSLGALLSNRTQQVLLEDNTSSSINSTSGVPQGSIHGHILRKTFCRRHNNLPPHHQPARLYCHPRGSRCPTVWQSSHAHPPTKHQTMHVTNKRNIIQSTYTIHNHNFQTTDTTKYLNSYVYITINGNNRINKTAQRANTTSAFPHRNIRTCPRKTKHIAYTTLVRPILEYTSIIWNPHTASTIHTLESVQRRSARHIMHNYSRHVIGTTMLQHLDLPKQQQRR